MRREHPPLDRWRSCRPRSHPKDRSSTTSTIHTHESPDHRNDKGALSARHAPRAHKSRYDSRIAWPGIGDWPPSTFIHSGLWCLVPAEGFDPVADSGAFRPVRWAACFARAFARFCIEAWSLAGVRRSPPRREISECSFPPLLITTSQINKMAAARHSKPPALAPQTTSEER